MDTFLNTIIVFNIIILGNCDYLKTDFDCDYLKTDFESSFIYLKGLKFFFI